MAVTIVYFNVLARIEDVWSTLYRRTLSYKVSRAVCFHRQDKIEKTLLFQRSQQMILRVYEKVILHHLEIAQKIICHTVQYIVNHVKGIFVKFEFYFLKNLQIRAEIIIEGGLKSTPVFCCSIFSQHIRLGMYLIYSFQNWIYSSSKKLKKIMSRYAKCEQVPSY